MSILYFFVKHIKKIMNLLYNINTEQGDKMRDLRILIISLSWLYTKELTNTGSGTQVVNIQNLGKCAQIQIKIS